MAPSPSSLSAALHSLRRATRRHRRLLAAGLVAASVAVGLEVVAPRPARTVPVVVAATDLSGGGLLQGRDLAVRRFDPQSVPAGASASSERLTGRVLAAPLRAGEPVTDVRLVGPALVRGYGEALVAAPVRIADADAVALLRVGDRVDVLAPDPSGELPPAQAATAAPVVAIPRPDTDLTGDTSGALVVLAVSSQAARTLARYAALGPLVVALRE